MQDHTGWNAVAFPGVGRAEVVWPDLVVDVARAQDIRDHLLSTIPAEIDDLIKQGRVKDMDHLLSRDFKYATVPLCTGVVGGVVSGSPLVPLAKAVVKGNSISPTAPPVDKWEWVSYGLKRCRDELTKFESVGKKGFKDKGQSDSGSSPKVKGKSDTASKQYSYGGDKYGK